MKQALLIGALALAASMSYPSLASAQSWDYDAFHSGALPESVWEDWLESAITFSSSTVDVQLGRGHLALSCISFGQTSYGLQRRDYCGLRVRYPESPALWVGLSPLRNLSEGISPAAGFDISFRYFSVITLFEVGDEPRQHVFFTLHLDRVWHSANGR